jgi:hypothetical protein
VFSSYPSQRPVKDPSKTRQRPVKDPSKTRQRPVKDPSNTSMAKIRLALEDPVSMTCVF